MANRFRRFPARAAGAEIDFLTQRRRDAKAQRFLLLKFLDIGILIALEITHKILCAFASSRLKNFLTR